MAIHARQSSMRLIVALVLVLSLVAAFFAIQVFVLHSQWSVGGVHAGSIANHALARVPKPLCNGSPYPC